MKTARSFENSSKGSYEIKEDFLLLNENARFNLGNELKIKGIETVFLSIVQIKESKHIFDFKYFSYFKDLKTVGCSIPFELRSLNLKHEINNIEGLDNFIYSLEEVHFCCKLSLLDIEYIKKFQRLISIYSDYQNQELIKSLVNLKEISIFKGDFEKLNLSKHSNLEYLYASNSKNLDLLNLWNIQSLKGFNSLMCKDFSNLNFLSRNYNLEALYLHESHKIINLPDFSNCVNLKYIFIVTLNNLLDIKSIATAKNLERVLISNCKNLKFNDFKFLANLSNLKLIVCYTNSYKQNKDLEKYFGKKYNIKEIYSEIILS